MAEQQVQPIIIKRIKKGGGGHHGGAWKVAYADFVTAMMAFFLLLWLLSVTTPSTRASLADYFTPTIGIKDSKGVGVKGGRNQQVKKGRSLSDLTSPGLVLGQVQQGPVSQMPLDVPHPKVNAESPDPQPQQKQESNNKQDEVTAQGQDSEQFSVTEKEVNQAMESDEDLKQLQNSVQVEQTNEGLKINLIDDPKQPMFAAGGATLTEEGKKVLDSMANIIAKTPNHIAIFGNTDAEGPSANPSYTNWELSVDRANAVRRALVTTQISADRVAKIVGMADRDLLVKEEPNNPRNRRVTIILIRGSYVRDPNQVKPTGRSVLSVGDAQLKRPDSEKTAAPVAAPVIQQPAKPEVFDILAKPEGR